MKDFINKFMEYWGKKDIVEQLIWLTAIALLVTVGSFSAYYYFDRYVAFGDISPQEIALEEVEALVRENPDDPELRIALADHYYQTGRYAESIKETYVVIDIYGDEYDIAYFLAGMSYLRLNDPEEAIPVLEHFIDLRSQSPMAHIDELLQTAYYFVGNEYYSQGEYEAAIPLLEEALKVNSADADSMFKLGESYLAIGQNELALEQYHEAVRFVPDFYEAYQGMIGGYTSLNMPDKVSYARGMQLFIEEDYDAAVSHLYSSYEADPEFVPNLLGLALVYEQLGQYDFALLYINEVLLRDPDNYLANNIVGRIQTLLQEDN